MLSLPDSLIVIDAMNKMVNPKIKLEFLLQDAYAKRYKEFTIDSIKSRITSFNNTVDWFYQLFDIKEKKCNKHIFNLVSPGFSKMAKLEQILLDKDNRRIAQLSAGLIYNKSFSSMKELTIIKLKKRVIAAYNLLWKYKNP